VRSLTKPFRRSYWIALIAAITLIAATAMFAAHGFADRDHDNGHCDLCVHFSGTAGSPAHAAVVGKPVLEVRLAALPPTVILPRQYVSRANLARGPPANS